MIKKGKYTIQQAWILMSNNKLEGMKEDSPVGSIHSDKHFGATLEVVVLSRLKAKIKEISKMYSKSLNPSSQWEEVQEGVVVETRVK
jgi:hypothetical protein